MASTRGLEWRKIPVGLKELCLNTTLRCGQSFRWRKSGDDEWSCALHGRILSVRQDTTHLYYRATFPSSHVAAPPTPPSSAAPSIKSEVLSDEDDTLSLVQHYFNLSQNLTDLYSQWSSADANFKKRAPKFTGVRILKQDAWEALVGFICSSNNNIIRISQMVEKLCVHYGPLIGHIDSQPFHDLPPASALTNPEVESHLRQLGFGYRAKYLHQTALMISNERTTNWLNTLRNPESPVLGVKPKPAGKMNANGREGYREAHEQLLELLGVGPKVADCVCLMGLGWGEAVPVDTHVWQIALRDYKFGKGKHRSLTKATYDAVADHFRELWGKEAGWAHSVLFAADLRTFSERLTTKVETEEIVDVVKKEEGAEEDVVKVKSEKGGKGKVKKEKTVKVEVKTEVAVKLEESENSQKRMLVVDEVEQTQKKRRRRG